MPYSKITDLPEQVKSLPMPAKNIWMAAFNSSFSDGNSEITCMKIAWAAVKNIYKKVDDKWIKKKEEIGNNIRINQEHARIQYKKDKYKPGEILDFQFCTVGPNVSEKTLDNFIENFNSDAFGQPVGWQVDHPFFREDEGNADKRRYGDVIEISRKGAEGWCKVRINSLGAEILNDRQYISNSPGWFTKYEHKITGEKIEDVLFEISATNIPAEKMMNLIIEMAEKEDNMPDKPGDKPEGKPGEKNPEENPLRRIYPAKEDNPEDKPEPEPEDFDKLYDRFKKDSGEITKRFRNKSGNTARRMKIDELLKDIQNKMNKKEEKVMAEDKGKAEENFKILQDELSAMKKVNEEKETQVKAMSEKIATLEEARFEAEIKTLAEGYLPKTKDGEIKYRLQKTGLGKFYPMARLCRTAEEKKTLKEFLDSLPETKISAEVNGVSGTSPKSEQDPDGKKILTDNEFHQKIQDEFYLQNG